MLEVKVSSESARWQETSARVGREEDREEEAKRSERKQAAMLSALRTPEKKKKTGKEEEEVEERGGEGSSVQVIEPTVTATATAFEQRVSEAVATTATATAVSVVQQENVAAQRKDDEEENPQGKRGKENAKAAGDDSEFVLFKGDQLRTAVQYRSSVRFLMPSSTSTPFLSFLLS